MAQGRIDVILDVEKNPLAILEVFLIIDVAVLAVTVDELLITLEQGRNYTSVGV